jgi:hypothetical protein
MRFGVRWPNGRVEHIFLSAAFVVSTVTIAFLIVVFAWMSAYCECLSQQHAYEQRNTSGQIDRNLQTTIAQSQERAQTPPQEADSDRCASPIGEVRMGTMEVLTFFVALFGGLTWRVYSQMRDYAMQTDRAYVALNVVLRPMMTFAVAAHNELIRTDPINRPIPIVAGVGLPNDPHTEISMLIGLTNLGNTPATVTDVVVSTYVGLPNSLPDEPPYDRSRMILPQGRSSAFLVKGGEATFDVTVRINETWPVQNGEWLWILGYVDYIDRYKRHHRAGFARICITPGGAGITDLRFEMKEGYNYDE